MIRKTIAIGLLSAMVGSMSMGCKDDAKTETEEAATAEAPATETTEKGEEAKPTDTATLPFKATGPVAVIDGKEIPAERFNEEAAKLAKLSSQLPPQVLERYREQIVQRLIDETLVDAALAEENIEVTEAEVQAKYDEFMQNFQTEEQKKMFFERIGISPEDVKEDMKKSVQLEKLLKKQAGIAVDDAAAKAFYDQNKKRYEHAEEVKASHILLKLEKDAEEAKVAEVKKKAQEIAKEAKAKDADFAELAKKYSEGPTAPKGGDLGFFPANRMVPEFSEAAFKLKPGTVSDPVRTDFGFHVIKVVEKKPAGTTPYEEVQEDIKTQLERTQMRDAMRKFLEGLKAEAKIENLADKNIEVNEAAMAKPGQQPGMPGMPPGMQGHPPTGGAAPGNAPKLKMPKLGESKPGADKPAAKPAAGE